MNTRERTAEQIAEWQSHKDSLWKHVLDIQEIPIGSEAVTYHVVDAGAVELSKVMTSNKRLSAYHAQQFLWMSDAIPPEHRPLIALIEYYDIPALYDRKPHALVHGLSKAYEYAREHEIPEIREFLINLRQYYTELATRISSSDDQEITDQKKYFHHCLREAIDLLDFMLVERGLDEYELLPAQWYILSHGEQSGWRWQHMSHYSHTKAWVLTLPDAKIFFWLIDDAQVGAESPALLEYGVARKNTPDQKKYILINESFLTKDPLGAKAMIMHEYFDYGDHEHSMLEAEKHVLSYFIDDERRQVIESHTGVFRNLISYFQSLDNQTADDIDHIRQMQETLEYLESLTDNER